MVSNTTQNNLAAVLEAPAARLKLINRETSTPGPKELLVRNHAIAANPAEWMMQELGWFITKYPIVLGSDSCGIVTAVGPGTTKFKVGDRVTGFAPAIETSDINNGSWQTYTILREISATKIPDSMSFEEASVFPMAVATVGISIFGRLGLARPSGSTAEEGAGFLVWGGASSVGATAIQFAKNLGLKVFATASPQHHDYLKSLGAFQVFDYHDADVVEKIIAAAKLAGTPIALGLDAVSSETTSEQSVAVLLGSGGKGSKLVTVLPGKKPNNDVEMFVPAALEVGTSEQELGEWLFNDYLREALQDGSIVSAPKIEIVPGGIAAAQLVFDKSKAGVSGTKLVVKVD